ncbi:hypothetical protein [Streptomyces roseolilacinus]|uniref:hypothetical protein n=1 Tax=Streptomyces roseolilacinus TaxID=66904 RepID=UPI0038135AED
MTSKHELAIVAVRAGRDMVRAAEKHGINSGAARLAARVADRAARAAEAAGCTAADYTRARTTR